MQYTKLGLYRENARSLSGYFQDTILRGNKMSIMKKVVNNIISLLSSYNSDHFIYLQQPNIPNEKNTFFTHPLTAICFICAATHQRPRCLVSILWEYK